MGKIKPTFQTVSGQSAEQEVWKPVVGYEGCYEVSNLGRVRSLGRYVRGKNGSRIFRIGRVLKQSLNRHGYYTVILCKQSKMKHFRTHRLVLQSFTVSMPCTIDARHLDGSRTNNQLSNLAWGTRKDNAEDRDRHGRTYRGPRGHSEWTSKLTPYQAKQIIHLYESGEFTQVELASMFKVTAPNISSIIRGRTWRAIVDATRTKEIAKSRNTRLMSKSRAAIAKATGKAVGQ